jgi:hypothetical protein
LEIVHNGKVIDAGGIATDGLSGSIASTIAIERSGWLALRTSGPPCAASMMRSMAAHTNPVWIEVQGHPADATRDAAYFLRSTGWKRISKNAVACPRAPRATSISI